MVVSYLKVRTFKKYVTQKWSYPYMQKYEPFKRIKKYVTHKTMIYVYLKKFSKNRYFDSDFVRFIVPNLSQIYLFSCVEVKKNWCEM